MSPRSDHRVRPEKPSTAEGETVPGPPEQAGDDRMAFWARQAGRLHWDTRWNQVLDWSGAPFARWFTGGKLNVAYNCVDRHVEAGHG
ncbi:acetyl-coenzyme A synthetase N-terminal domain-containing protein, partial [Streptomyces sparsogenes]|uniref:acetyl-coenzyme A synthetase N-terminal domain-containing protein n=1 Tax=Streptomyces sparsogenes TaxID=67365 RepID=UPI0033C5F628